MRDMIKVVVADDSAFMRRKIGEILERDPGIRVIAAARNGQDAVDQVKRHRPDVVALDINMPVMDGITALQVIMMECPCPVVMISSLTREGALTTFECLELGAVDFVGKLSGTISTDIDRQAREIVAKIRTAARARVGRCGVRVPGVPRFGSTNKSGSGGAADKIVAIGVSTGGPKTLLEVLPYLPSDLDAAVVIVQHMPEGFTRSFAQRLNQECALPIKEAEAGELLLRGHGYLARGGKHLIFAKRALGDGVMARYTSHPAEEPHAPSVDVMMRSAAERFGSNVIGVLLTGMGADGADGMVAIRNAGGCTIAEDESTCVVFGMPAQAIARGGADFVLPCDRIAEKLVELLAGGRTLVQEGCG